MHFVHSKISILIIVLFAHVQWTQAIKKSQSPKNSRTAPSTFCENYSACLEKLETKQRECLKFPSESMDLRGSSTLRAAADSTNSTIECTKRKRKDLHRELAQLHLRQTEILRNCITKNSHRAQSTLNPLREKKCLATNEKLTTFVDIIHQSSDGKKGKRVKNNGENAAKKKHAKKNKSDGTSTTTPSTGIESTTSNGFARSKRKATSSALSKRKEANVNKKQNAKICKRSKKSVARKCHQIAKCCSIVGECELEAQVIDEQIISLKAQLKSPPCVN